MKYVEVVVLHECVDLGEEGLDRFGVLLAERRTDRCPRRCHHPYAHNMIHGRPYLRSAGFGRARRCRRAIRVRLELWFLGRRAVTWTSYPVLAGLVPLPLSKLLRLRYKLRLLLLRHFGEGNVCDVNHALVLNQPM